MPKIGNNKIWGYSFELLNAMQMKLNILKKCAKGDQKAKHSADGEKTASMACFLAHFHLRVSYIHLFIF